MTTNLKILNSRIPPGGRNLTSTEVRSVRASGLRNVSKWSWVHPAHGTDNRGHLYRPATGGGYNSVDGYVLEVR